MTAARVRFHRLALREYLDAWSGYARRSARAAQSFRDEVAAAVQRIQAHPKAAAADASGCRWVRTRRYLYVLHYFLPNDQLAVVLAVAHARRRPGYWRRRLRNP